MYFHTITDISYTFLKKFEHLSLLISEQVTGWNNSKIGSMIDEGRYDNLSKSLAETIKIDIPPFPFYNILIKAAPITSYPR